MQDASGVSLFRFHAESGENTCQTCEEHDGETLTLEELTAKGMLPPLHKNCRCKLEAVDGAEARTRADYEAIKTLVMDYDVQKSYNGKTTAASGVSAEQTSSEMPPLSPWSLPDSVIENLPGYLKIRKHIEEKEIENYWGQKRNGIGNPNINYGALRMETTDYETAKRYIEAVTSQSALPPADFMPTTKPFSIFDINMTEMKAVMKLLGVAVVDSGPMLLDGAQTGLDLIGLAPGIGEIADGINAGLYALRGDPVNAGLSAAAAMPFAGWAATGGKLGKKAIDAAGAASAAAKHGDEIAKQALKRTDVVGGVGKRLKISDSQFGEKVGKHAEDFGLDANNAASRDFVKNRANEIFTNKTEIRQGMWRGQGALLPNGTNASGIVNFYIQGKDVVVTDLNGIFITIMKDGINNPRVIDATKIWP